jgi:HPr kinase/phosphorylase
MPITVKRLLDDATALDLRVLAGAREMRRRRITEPDVQRLGLALAGFTDHVERGRVQIVDAAELTYLRTLAADARRDVLRAITTLDVPCLVVAGGAEVPPDVVETAELAGMPLLATRVDARGLILDVERFLFEHLMPSTHLHGVLVDVLGVGVLILGKSGIGKSECALELVLRGHRLVADDVVEVRRRPGDAAFGHCADALRHHMEIRGLGIINMCDLFGAAAVRDRKRIELVVELLEWDPTEEYDRLGVEEQNYDLLGVAVPRVRVPVRPGRTIATIIEVAARNQLLKQRGHHSARLFTERTDALLATRRAAPAAVATAASLVDATTTPPAATEETLLADVE